MAGSYHGTPTTVDASNGITANGDLNHSSFALDRSGEVVGDLAHDLSSRVLIDLTLERGAPADRLPRE